MLQHPRATGRDIFGAHCILDAQRNASWGDASNYSEMMASDLHPPDQVCLLGAEIRTIIGSR